MTKEEMECSSCLNYDTKADACRKDPVPTKTSPWLWCAQGDWHEQDQYGRWRYLSWGGWDGGPDNDYYPKDWNKPRTEEDHDDV